jgi:NodT family efflux transporter outer membrane factor (OMF) lipoprotein
MLTACAVGPDFLRPAAPDVTRYTNTDMPAKTASTTGPDGAMQTFMNGKDVPQEWWKQFGCESLNVLVAHALTNNPDLKAADASLRIAQENYYAARGELFPTVDVNAGATREKFNPSAFGETGVPSSIFTLYNASINVSYAIDVFGGERRAIEKAYAETNYQRYEQQAAYLTLVANVVTAAIQEASLSQQIKETQNIIEIETKELNILKKQLTLGAIPKSTVLEQEAVVSQTQTILPPLEKQLAQQHNLLAVLAGDFPGNNTDAAFDLSLLKLPEELPVSLPSRLVEQRPDIRAAEEQLHEASAGIGVATANMLPQINLTGAYGTESIQSGALFGPQAELWSLGAGLAQPIFHGGELLHAKRAASAGYDKAAAQYKSTVLGAFKNVADTLHALQFDAEGLAAQVTAEAAARNSLELAATQFDAGAISYPQLLDAERTYQQARIGLVQAQAARLADTVALFQSLGGSVKDAPQSQNTPSPTVEKKP